MHLRSSLAAMSFLSALSFGSAAMAEVIGQVDRVQNEATAEAQGNVRKLAAADPVAFGDVLRAHAASRLEATLIDDTQLTLGENSVLTVDEYVYDPAKSGGRMALTILGGTFLFKGGRVEAPEGGNVTLTTSFATLGVRGTTVWGGPLDGAFAVFVLDGEVTVTNGGATVTLTNGTGTTIQSETSAPEAPVTWGQARIDRAIATISFGP